MRSCELGWDENVHSITTANGAGGRTSDVEAARSFLGKHQLSTLYTITILWRKKTLHKGAPDDGQLLNHFMLLFFRYEEQDLSA